MKIKLISLLLVLFANMAVAQQTINVMFYNLLEFPISPPGGRDVILKNILNEFEPDIFMVCELQNETGADMILNTSLNDEGIDFERAEFVLNQSGASNLQQLLFYRSTMFSLESQEIITTSVRDINKYILKLNTTDQQTDPIYLYVYIAHLKSSQGTANQNLRLEMMYEFTDDLATIPANSFVIFGGDYNLYTSSEPAYQELLDVTNAIVMKDPADMPGSWNNNENFQIIHTQSTRIQAGSAGAGGGLDDRFDFITFSENFETNSTLYYIPDTYKSFGNNGNCFNKNISSATCTGEFSQTLRNNLYSMSDHLPVVLQLETTKEFVLTNTDFTVDKTVIIQKNPVENYLIISSNQVSLSTITLYNMMGQVVRHVSQTDDSNTVSVDVSGLSSGLYYVTTNILGSTPLKFIKK